MIIELFQYLIIIIIIIIIIKNLYSAKTIEEYSKALYIELIKINKNEILKFKIQKKKHVNYSNKLKAFLKRNVLSCFLKMARLLLVLIVNGSDFHKTGAA